MQEPNWIIMQSPIGWLRITTDAIGIREVSLLSEPPADYQNQPKPSPPLSEAAEQLPGLGRREEAGGDIGYRLHSRPRGGVRHLGVIRSYQHCVTVGSQEYQVLAPPPLDGIRVAQGGPNWQEHLAGGPRG